MNPKQFAQTMLDAITAEIFDLDEIVRLCLVALYTNGHVLLEGNPGLGKTELVKTLGSILHFRFGRIQFTPDLMPADITGTLMPVGAGDNPYALVFQPGPIFTSLLLADEINRATPKTQSAMLEAMAECQVTVLGKQHKLDAPFMVLATQNPIDHDGTYALPEAQADRFMFKLDMPAPSRATIHKILAKTTEKIPAPRNGAAAMDPETARLQARERHGEYYARIRDLSLLPSAEQHVSNLLLASNGQFDQLAHDAKRKHRDTSGLDAAQIRNVKDLVERCVRYGLGPRAARDMTLGAKAWSFFFATAHNDLADGLDLARVVIPVLRHRIKLHYDWQDHYKPTSRLADSGQAEPLVRFIADLCLCTAPKANGYDKVFEQALKSVLDKKYGGV